MKIEFRKSFLKDLEKLRNAKLKILISDCIEQVEAADNISKIKNLKKLSGYDIYYRIRIGDYRMGIKIVNDTIYFVVFEHRKQIYNTFP